MRKRLRIAIVGYGTGGQASALMLVAPRSRWLTPLFQSERDFAARWRDWLFHPLSRTPGAREQMLRVPSGSRKGWLGRMALPEGFVEAPAVARPRELESQAERHPVSTFRWNRRWSRMAAKHRVLNENHLSERALLMNGGIEDAPRLAAQIGVW